MIKIDLNSNKKEKLNVKYLATKIKEEIKYFLIIITLLSIFSKRSASLDYEKEITNCETKKEVETASKSFIYFIKKEIKKNDFTRQLPSKNIFYNEIIDIKSNLLDLKKQYLDEIKELLESEKINFENLDIEFNNKKGMWKELNLTKLILNDPIKFFIINPLNKISKIAKTLFFKNKISNSEFFFLDVIIKLTICNLISLIMVKEGSSFLATLEKNKNTNENFSEEEEAFNSLKESISNTLISLQLGFFLIKKPSFTMKKAPNFIDEISFLSWLFLTIIFLNLLPYLVNKEIKEGIKKEDKSEVISYITNSSIITLIILLIFKSQDKNSKIINLLIILNSMISSILKIIIHIIWKRNKEKNTL